MIVIEDINYSIDDIIDQVNTDFGFSYVEDTDNTGHYLLSPGVRLNLEFNETEKKLDSADLILPDNHIELSKSKVTSELYATSIESATQIVDLITRMLGGGSSGEDIE